VAVSVTAQGTGYTSLPTVGFSTSGSTTAATASTTDLTVVSVGSITPGSYSTFPTASIAGNATLGALTAQIASVTISNGGAGSGYTSAPSVTFTGAGGSGTVATSTINILAVTLTYGGGGYSAAPSVTFGGGGTGATATATINPGTVMTPGTSPKTASFGTAGVQASPITEIFTNANTDLLFYGYTGEIVAQNVTGGSISTTTTAAEAGGTSGIVVDNISTSAQASSIYFATLAQTAISGPQTENIASAKSSGSVIFSTNTATVTTQAPHGFTTGESITVAGVTCGSGSCSQSFNGTFTITVTSTTVFTYDISTCLYCGGETANANTGTATGIVSQGTGYAAVKLTQSGLN
jgi:hypothetical protein